METTPTDVAWLVGNSGFEDNWELRYSLRSFAKHAQFPGKVILIGRCPAWVDKSMVWHIPCDDPYKNNKDANLIRKASLLAAQPEITDPFILCSDDHILLKDSYLSDFGHYHSGPLPDGPRGHRWRNRLWHTRQLLEEIGCPSALNFDGHIPYALHKAWLPPPVDWQHRDCTVFSTILNIAAGAGLITPRPINESRVRGWLKKRHSTGRAKKKLKQNRFAVLDNWSVLVPEFRSLIAAKFPDPAPWEKDR